MKGLSTSTSGIGFTGSDAFTFGVPTLLSISFASFMFSLDEILGSLSNKSSSSFVIILEVSSSLYASILS